MTNTYAPTAALTVAAVALCRPADGATWALCLLLGLACALMPVARRSLWCAAPYSVAFAAMLVCPTHLWWSDLAHSWLPLAAAVAAGTACACLRDRAASARRAGTDRRVRAAEDLRRAA